MRRIALLLGALFAGSLLLAAPASAHATLVASTPADGARLRAAPRTVTLTFDEDVELGQLGYLHVTDEAGRSVDAGAAYHPDGHGTKVADVLRTGLGDGSYTASFRVVSADAHPVAGSVAFVVGSGPLVRRPGASGGDVARGTRDALDLARWLSYAGLALLGGSWLMLTVWPAGRGEPRARRILWAGSGAVGAGAVFELLLQGPYAAGRGVGSLFTWTLLDDTLHTDYGQLHVARLLLLGVLAGVLVRALGRGGRAARAAAALLGVGVVWTFSRSGHPATTSPSWLSVPIDMAHLLAVAIWLGGLIMVLGAVLPRREPDELRTVLPVFSRAALGAVTVLVASGTYAACRGIGTVHAVFATTYGQLVVAKVFLLGVALLVANLSRRIVHGRVLAYAMTDAVVDAPPVVDEQVRFEQLRRTVLVEAIIGLAVLVFSAVLVAEPRGKEALLASYRQPVTAAAPLGGHNSLQISATPGVHGLVTFTVVVSDGRNTKSITASATQHDRRIGPLPIRLTRARPGYYTGSATLPVAGSWELDFVVTTSAFDATTTDATLHLH